MRRYGRSVAFGLLVRYVPSVTTTTSATRCEACGTIFDQPDDPGRRREYCSNACRQRAYRARGGRASGTRRESARARQRREEQDAWAREEARRERDRERKARARGRGSERLDVPDWCRPRAGDDSVTAKKRGLCESLWKRAAHAGTPAPEASACRERAEAIRARYSL